MPTNRARRGRCCVDVHWPAVGGHSRAWPAPTLRASPAYAGLCPCAPVQGEVSPCEPLWPAFQLNPCLPKPIKHTRPRGGPCPYSLVWSHPNDVIGFSNLRAVTNGPGKQRRLRRVFRSDIFVTIRVVKPAYIALMFIGPPL